MVRERSTREFLDEHVDLETRSRQQREQGRGAEEVERSRRKRRDEADREDVEDAAPEPARAVLALAKPTFSVLDRNLGDTKAAEVSELGNEPVGTTVEPQRLRHVASHQ